MPPPLTRQRDTPRTGSAEVAGVSVGSARERGSAGPHAGRSSPCSRRSCGPRNFGGARARSLHLVSIVPSSTHAAGARLTTGPNRKRAPPQPHRSEPQPIGYRPQAQQIGTRAKRERSTSHSCQQPTPVSLAASRGDATGRSRAELQPSRRYAKPLSCYVRGPRLFSWVGAQISPRSDPPLASKTFSFRWSSP